MPPEGGYFRWKTRRFPERRRQRCRGSSTMENFWSEPPQVGIFHAHDFENIWSEHSHITHRIELLYVLEGKFTLTLDNGLKFPAVAGDFLLIPEEVRHRDVFDPSRGLRVLTIHFKWEHSADYFAVVNNRTLCDMDYATRSEAMRRIDFMYEQWEPDELGKLNAGIQLHALLMLFYTSAVRAAGRGNPSAALKRTRPDVARQVKFFLTQNYASEFTLEQLARRFEVSPAYLSRLFRHEFGVSFSRYLTTLRLEAAVALLHNTALRVSEVALRCGFNADSYFIQVFRAHFGTTPGDYRRGIRREEKK